MRASKAILIGSVMKSMNVFPAGDGKAGGLAIFNVQTRRFMLKIVSLTVLVLALSSGFVQAQYCPGFGAFNLVEYGTGGDAVRLNDSQYGYWYRLYLDGQDMRQMQTGDLNGSDLIWANLSPGIYRVIAQEPCTFTTHTYGPLNLGDPGNALPVVNAGIDQTIQLPANATVAGSATDSDGTIVSYAWTQLSGPNTGSISSPSNATTTITGLIEGTYVFRLTVTDNNSGSGFDDISIVVATTTNNTNPVADAGIDQTLQLPANATVAGSATDSDGTIVSYAWTQLSGPNTASISSPSNPTTTITGLVEGTYVFRLNVTDNNSGNGFDDISIVVGAATNNTNPVANAGPDIPLTLPASQVTLNGSGSDADGTISSYLWTQQSGPSTATIANSTSQSTLVSNLQQGTYVFRLTVTDNNSGTHFDEVTVTVGATATLSNYNYIRETKVRVAGAVTDSAVAALPMSDKSINITYFDGLGRPMQSVQQQASPSGKDIIQPIEYDAYGRETKKYLPYADSDNAYGTYRTAAIAAQNWFYNTPPTGVVQIPAAGGITPAFAETVFELSPLNRMSQQGAPGSAWQISQGHTVKMEYLFNNNIALGQTDSRPAALYKALIAGNGTRTLVRENDNATYADNQLTVTVVKDENWVSGLAGTTEEYKDKSGNVVLKRTYNVKPDNSIEALSTYYVYDDFGSLAFVLPPGANPDAATAISTATLANFCYQYRYDERQRLVEKQLPGKGAEYMVYNKLDQVVATQDANQRAKSTPEWSFMKYDAHGRVIGTGTWVHTTPAISRPDLQDLVYQNAILWEQATSATVNLADIGYSDQAFPTMGTKTWQTVNYYDTYQHLNLQDFTYEDSYSQSAALSIKGLPAASKVRVLGGTDWLLTANYYNAKGEPIQAQAGNYVQGKDTYNSKYNFSGELTGSQRKHYKNGFGTANLTINERMTYDATGRLLKRYHKANEGLEISLASHMYNEIGQLREKQLHQNTGPVAAQITLTSADNVAAGEEKHLVASDKIILSPGFEVARGATFSANIISGGGTSGGPANLGPGQRQLITYNYNERGWLTGINDPNAVTAEKVFGMKLYYADHADAGKKQYNGNISRMDWQSKVPAGYSLTQQQQNFDYNYDKLNRLTKADYMTSGTAGKFNEELQYDLMGNIVALKRANSMSGYLHNFTYNYSNNVESGNKLWAITDAITDPGTAPLTSAYTYDANGNMLTDSKKGIAITYNEFNLPNSVTKTNNSNLTYTYDAGGRKLKKQYGADTRDYVSGIEYNNGSIEFVQTAEGRIIPGATGYTYEYSLKDHLGNTRAMVNQDGSILQVQDYYAFGLEMNANNQVTPSPDNKYKYNGKELQPELEQYDYGARFYDPIIGRWATIDPLSEISRRWSPYSYALNNPIRYIDVDGMYADDPLMLNPVRLTQNIQNFGKFIANTVIAVFNAFSDPVSNANYAGNTTGAKSAAYTQAANEGVRALATDALLGGAAGMMGGKVVGALSRTEAASVATVGERATAIHEAVSGATQRRTTIAVGEGTDASGNMVRVVGSNETTLRKQQRALLQPGEIEAIGPGHAEATVLNHAKNNGIKIGPVGASRPICASCATQIQNSGAFPATPLKPVKPMVLREQ